MKFKNIIKFIFLILTPAIFFGQELKEQFNFPENRMGNFAKTWFKSINSQDSFIMKPYLVDNEDSKMFLSLLLNHSEKVGGITPYMISYQTEEEISIYSKENNGGWVKVNLGLKLDGEISNMGIKKSYKPLDYTLKGDMNQNQSKIISEAIKKEIESNYVLKSRRSEISEKLTKTFYEQQYDTISQGDLFANKMTELLVAIANDKHLQVIAPAQEEQIKVRFKSNENEEDTNTDVVESFVKYKKIDNEIGYLNIERFAANKEQYASIETALQNFINTKAIIIDLRNSGGGDAEAASNFLSYFFNSKQFVSKSIDDGGNVVEQWTVPNKLSPKISAKPLYVLTGSKTISASEAFVYFLKIKKKAVLVGETTAGAGFMVDAFELPFGFYFVNSIFSPFDYDNGEGWQGSGVNPDFAVSKRKALEKALELISNKKE